MNIAKLIQKIKGNTKLSKNIFIFLALFLFSYNSTFAATADEIKDTVSTVAAALLQGISMILALFTYLSTVFLSPAWINGSLFGMNSYFKDIWILVSNLVYFIFAFVLIWIAFMNIVGKTGEHYELKKALPKFIVGVLIVPISWYFIQFVLSISAVLTISGLTLPFETFETYESALDKVKIPKNCTLDLTSVLGEGTGSTSGASSSDGFFSCDKEGDGAFISITEVTGKGDAIDSIFGIVAMYTYGIVSVDTLDGLSKEDMMKNVKSLGDLIVKIVFDLLFVFIYSILMIAIGLVLMVRGIYIWIYMMISPVFGLMYFFGMKEGLGGGFFSKFTLTNFISLALVPVYTMLALSFGLLFLYVVGSGMSSTTGNVDDSDVKVNENSVTVGQFSLNIKGQISKIESSTGLMKEIGGTALGIVGSLILKVFGVVVLWGVIMAALNSSKITEEIVKPLYEFGGKIGQIAMQAPGNIPIFGGQSMQSMNQVAGNVSSTIQGIPGTKASKFIKENMKFIDPDNIDRTTNLNKASNNIKNISANGPTSELKNQYENVINQFKNDPTRMINNEGFIVATKGIAEKLGIKSDDFKYGDMGQIAKTVVGKIEEEFDKNTSIGGGLAKGQRLAGTLDENWLRNLVEGTGRGGVNENQAGNTAPVTNPTPGAPATPGAVTNNITVIPSSTVLDPRISSQIQGISSANRGELETKLKAIPEVTSHSDSVNLIKQILDATYPPSTTP